MSLALRYIEVSLQLLILQASFNFKVDIKGTFHLRKHELHGLEAIINFLMKKKRRLSHGFLHCAKPSLVARKQLNVLPSFRSLQVVIFKCQFSNSEKLEMQKLRATKSTLLRNTLKKTSIYFDRAHNF